MKHLPLLLLLLTLLSACNGRHPKYVIGVSQCSADIWREKQNAELRMGAYFRDDVELRFAAAYDSDERQVQQIDSLVATGIDLLIVAPNQVATISPAIDRAYDSGIPVIVFERKTNSQKFTAFMSADNYEMGSVMGLHIAQTLGGKGRVLEVKGLKGSSPAIERHNGFAEALKRYPDIDLVAVVQGDWTEKSAYEAVTRWLATAEGRRAAAAGIDYVFAQNDRMAMGARRALASSKQLAQVGGKLKLPLFCGIDGLPGPGGGIELVRDSVLDATYIYPTHGDRLLSQSIDILENRPYEKEVKLMSAIVTSDNAFVLQMQAEETLRQTDYLDQLHDRADNYLQQLSLQRAITLLAFGMVVLLLAVLVLYYLNRRGKNTLRRERVVNNLWNLETKEEALQSSRQEPQSAEHLTQETMPQPVSDATVEAGSADADAAHADTAGVEAESLPPAAAQDAVAESVASSIFIGRFKEAVEKRLSDSELSIEHLAADMNLSRVQLYRKVKTITGSSPVELLRTARLNRGYQLLLTTDKTISEVAYAVGFSAPSYFTKCFKDEFGQSPTDIRQ